MSGFTSTVVGSVFILGGLLAVTAPLATEDKFLHVYSVKYSEGDIVSDRYLRWKAFADWRVTIVGLDEDAPICVTHSGPNLNEGWSSYTEIGRSTSRMSLDAWVGDEGCLDRIRERNSDMGSPQEYRQYMTWTPRDATPPVVHTHRTIID